MYVYTRTAHLFIAMPSGHVNPALPSVLVDAMSVYITRD